MKSNLSLLNLASQASELLARPMLANQIEMESCETTPEEKREAIREQELFEEMDKAQIGIDNAHVRLALNLISDDDLVSSVPVIQFPKRNRAFVRFETLLFALMLCVAGAYVGMLVASLIS